MLHADRLVGRQHSTDRLPISGVSREHGPLGRGAAASVQRSGSRHLEAACPGLLPPCRPPAAQQCAAGTAAGLPPPASHVVALLVCHNGPDNDIFCKMHGARGVTFAAQVFASTTHLALSAFCLHVRQCDQTLLTCSFTISSESNVIRTAAVSVLLAWLLVKYNNRCSMHGHWRPDDMLAPYKTGAVASCSNKAAPHDDSAGV